MAPTVVAAGAVVAVVAWTLVTLTVVIRLARAARATARRTDDRLRRIGAATAELAGELDRLHRDVAMLTAVTERALTERNRHPSR